ncbi:MAG: DUF5711 family protein [Acutalibacteraceae bacterium]
MANDSSAKKNAVKQKKKRLLPRPVKYLLLILVLLALGTFVAANHEALAPANIKTWFQQNLLGYSEGDGYPVPFPGTTVDYNNFVLSDGRPAVVSDTSFAMYRGGGAQLAAVQHGFSSPMLQNSGSRFLLFNLGGKKYMTGDSGSFGSPASYDFSIYGGAIASNGSFAILSGAQGYASMATVFDSRGSQLFRWASQNYLLSACSLSETGQQLAAAGFTTQNGDLISQVSLFSITSDSPTAVFTLQNSLPRSIGILQNGSLFFIGDRSAAVLNPENGQQTEYDYHSAALFCSAFRAELGGVVALSSSGGRNASVVFLAADGSVHSVAKFSDPVLSLDLSADGILVLSGGKLMLLDENGTMLSSAEAGSDAQRALYAGSGICYVLGLSELRRVELQSSQASSAE